MHVHCKKNRDIFNILHLIRVSWKDDVQDTHRPSQHMCRVSPHRRRWSEGTLTIEFGASTSEPPVVSMEVWDQGDGRLQQESSQKSEVVKNEIFSSEYESMMLVSWKNSRFPRQLDKWFRCFVAFSYLFGPWILWSSGPFLLLFSGSLIHNTTPFSLVPFLRFTKHMCSNGGHNTSGNAVKPLLFLVGEGDICFQVLLGDRNQFFSRVCDSVPLLTHFWSSPLYPLGCGAKV